MPLSNMQYNTIMREYDRRQAESRHILEEHTQEVYTNIPRLAEIQDEIASVSAAQIRERLLHSSSEDAHLQATITRLCQERDALLLQNGYPVDYLKPSYQCPVCQDTGYVNGEKCACFRQAAIELLYNQSNIKNILEKENFQSFSFEWYSDKIKDSETGQTPLAHARFAYQKSLEFIDQFGESGENLFIYGDTGVGKTFLSHCIAWELLQQGFSVLYFSAGELFQSLANQTFSKEEDTDSLTMDSILETDLLIMDDLGTELTNNFVKTELFTILNERILRRKSIIISTNYDMETFSNIYTTRIFSRIMQDFLCLNLIGQDIRVQKVLGGNNK